MKLRPTPALMVFAVLVLLATCLDDRSDPIADIEPATTDDTPTPDAMADEFADLTNWDHYKNR